MRAAVEIVQRLNGENKEVPGCVSRFTISPPVQPRRCEHKGMWYVLEELAVISVLLTKESSRGA